MYIKDFVALIEKRPGMYVFSEGLTEFSGLIRGWQMSRRAIGNDDGDSLVRNFSVWLKEEKFPIFSNHEISWCRLLLASYPCESRALNKFFELWNEYLVYIGE